MKDIIICDLDGTLANCEHRVHHVKNKPKNWDAFYAGIQDDKVNEAVLAVLKEMINPFTHYQLIFCSGRPHRCQRDTERWLGAACGFDYRRYKLFMRADGDYRQDWVVKEEILNTQIDKSRVLFVLDDRQQVVNMWRRNGLTCFQVAEGNF